MAVQRKSTVLWLAAIALAGTCAFPVALKWREERNIRVNYQKVKMCLLGDATVGPERAEYVHRSVEVGAAIDKVQDWPKRCLRPLHHLSLALRRTQERDENCRKPEPPKRCLLRRQLEAVVVDGGRYAQGDTGAAFDAVEFVSLGDDLALAAAGDEGASSAKSVAPRAAAVLNPADMTPLYTGNYLRLLTNPAGSSELQLLFYDPQRRYGSCRLMIDGDGGAGCGILPPNVPVGLAGELFATQSGAPPRLYAQGPSFGGWRQSVVDMATGNELEWVSDRPSGGFVWTDGTYVRLGVDPPVKKLAAYRVTSETREAAVLVAQTGQETYGPKLIFDEIVSLRANAKGGHELFAQRVFKEGRVVSPLVRVGNMKKLGGRPVVDVCRTEEALFLIVFGKRKQGVAGAAVAIRREGKWSMGPSFSIRSERFGFTCNGSTGTVTWIRGSEERTPSQGWFDASDVDPPEPTTGAYQVHRVRCGKERCDQDHSTVTLERFSRSSRYVAGDFGLSTGVLWRSKLGDIRLKVAPLAELPHAPSIPLFDDLEHDGFGWDLERDPIIGRAGHVLLLVSRQGKAEDETLTYGVRIKSDGTVTSVTVN